MCFTAMYIVAFHSRTCGILNNYAGSEYFNDLKFPVQNNNTN